MIDVVINFDQSRGEFKLYEPTTDTLLITTSLGETFAKFDEFLKERGLIATDILSTADINYHIDSFTFIAMVKSNADLLKRLSNAPSGFMISSNRFGVSQTQSNSNFKESYQKDKKGKNKKKNAIFSKSSFNNSNKKFGSNT
jgi:hypothetical protein